MYLYNASFLIGNYSRYTVDEFVYYMGTTLCESLFTINVIKDLYNIRWDIESHFDTIVSNIISAEPRLKDFHSKSEDHEHAMRDN